jgi:F-type H+-transporting ATPase subunit b
MNSLDGPTLVPDATLLGELAVFLIVLAVVSRYVLPRLYEVIVQRQQQVADRLAAADAAENRAHVAEANANARLRAARQQAREIIDEGYERRAWLISEGVRRGREEYEYYTRPRPRTRAITPTAGPPTATSADAAVLVRG